MTDQLPARSRLVRRLASRRGHHGRDRRASGCRIHRRARRRRARRRGRRDREQPRVLVGRRAAARHDQRRAPRRHGRARRAARARQHPAGDAGAGAGGDRARRSAEWRPTGHPAPLTTVVDEDLAGYAEIWAAGGTPHTVFPLTFDELVRADRRRRVVEGRLTLRVRRRGDAESDRCAMCAAVTAAAADHACGRHAAGYGVGSGRHRRSSRPSAARARGIRIPRPRRAARRRREPPASCSPARAIPRAMIAVSWVQTLPP